MELYSVVKQGIVSVYELFKEILFNLCSISLSLFQKKIQNILFQIPHLHFYIKSYSNGLFLVFPFSLSDVGTRKLLADEVIFAIIAQKKFNYSYSFQGGLL
jgi:hypothetical protein